MESKTKWLQESVDMQWHTVTRLLAVYRLFKRRPMWGIGRKVYDILHPDAKTLESIHYYELDRLKFRIEQLETQLKLYKHHEN